MREDTTTLKIGIFPGYSLTLIKTNDKPQVPNYLASIKDAIELGNRTGFDSPNADIIGVDLTQPASQCLNVTFRLARQHYVLVVGADQLNLFSTKEDFQSLFDPCSRFEQVSAGYKGHLIGFPVFTDGYIWPKHNRFIGNACAFLYCPAVMQHINGG